MNDSLSTLLELLKKKHGDFNKLIIYPDGSGFIIVQPTIYDFINLESLIEYLNK